MVGKEDRDSAGSAGGDGETGHSPVERGAGALSVNAGLGDFPQAFFGALLGVLSALGVDISGSLSG